MEIGNYFKVSNAKGGEERRVESSSKIKDGNGKMGQGEDVRRIWKDYFDAQYIIDTQEQVVVHKCGIEGIWRDVTTSEKSQLEELRFR